MHNREALKLSACAFAPFAIRFGLMLFVDKSFSKDWCERRGDWLDLCFNGHVLECFFSFHFLGKKEKKEDTAKLGTLRSGQCPDLSHGLIRYAKPLLMVR